MLASSAKKCQRERRKRCIFLVSPKFIWPKQRAPVSFYYFTFVLLTWWLDRLVQNYLMPNMRSPLLRKEILVLGSACQTSSPVPLEEPWQLLVRVSQIHELVSSLELSWFIKGFASLNTDCWFLENRTLVRSGCDRDSCCLLQWKIQMSRSLGRRWV